MLIVTDGVTLSLQLRYISINQTGDKRINFVQLVQIDDDE